MTHRSDFCGGIPKTPGRAFFAVFIGFAAACDADGNESEAEAESESEAEASEAEAESEPCPKTAPEAETPCEPSAPSCCYGKGGDVWLDCSCSKFGWSCAVIELSCDSWDPNVDCDYRCGSDGCVPVDDGSRP